MRHGTPRYDADDGSSLRYAVPLIVSIAGLAGIGVDAVVSASFADKMYVMADSLQAKPRLVIVCGLPGSGKTTHSRRAERELRAIRLCPDEWMDVLQVNLWHSETRQRVEQLQWKLAQDYLGLGHNVVIEWGTWAKSERDVLRIGARAIGAGVELHFLDEPIDVLYERISRRKRESPPIQRDDMAKWTALFERPSPEELALFDAPLPGV